MNQALLAIASKIVISFFSVLAQAVWDQFWDLVKEGIQEAEQEWVKTGSGTIRVEYVLDKVLAFIETKKKLSWLQKRAFQRVLKHFMTRVVKYLNDQVGKDWGSKIDDLKKFLADKIPVIE